MTVQFFLTFYLFTSVLGFGMAFLDEAGSSDLNAVRVRLEEEKAKRLLLENDVEVLMMKVARLERGQDQPSCNDRTGKTDIADLIVKLDCKLLPNRRVCIMIHVCLVVCAVSFSVTEATGNGFVAERLVKHGAHLCRPVYVPQGYEYVACAENGGNDTIKLCEGDMVQPDDVSSEYEPICVALNCPIDETEGHEECVSGKCRKVCICSRKKGLCGDNYLNCNPLPDPRHCLPEFVEQDCTCRLPTSVSANVPPVDTRPAVPTPFTTTLNVVQTAKGNPNKRYTEPEKNSSVDVVQSEMQKLPNKPVVSSSRESEPETGTNWTAILVPVAIALVIVVAVAVLLYCRKRNAGNDNTDNSISFINCCNFTKDQHINVGHGGNAEAVNRPAQQNVQDVYYRRINQAGQMGVEMEEPLAMYQYNGGPVGNAQVDGQPRHTGSNETIPSLLRQEQPYDQSQNAAYSHTPNRGTDPDLRDTEHHPLIAQPDARSLSNSGTDLVVPNRLSEIIPLTYVGNHAASMYLGSENTIPTGQSPIKENHEEGVESSNGYTMAASETQSTVGGDSSKDLADGQVDVTSRRRKETESKVHQERQFTPREMAIVLPMVQSPGPSSSMNEPVENSFPSGPLFPRPELPSHISNTNDLDPESLGYNS